MKLKDMTDQDLFNMVRTTILEKDRRIAPHISREINRRKRVNPDAFDFLKPPSEPKKPSVRLSLTNRECNILLGELHSAIQFAKDWLHDHPEGETNDMVESRMNEKIAIMNKFRNRMGE
jgi:hypothetical protein